MSDDNQIDAEPKPTTGSSGKWHPPRRVDVPNSLQTNGSELNQAFAEMEKAIKDRLNSVTRGLFVVSAPAGLGKSTVVANELAGVCEARNVRAVWFGTRHDQFYSVIRAGYWTDVWGRHGDEIDKYGTLHPANCERHEIAQRLGRIGQKSTDILCSPSLKADWARSRLWCRVPRNECLYWQQFMADTHKFMVMEHLRMAPLWAHHNTGLIVVDEGDAEDFAPDKVSLTLKDLAHWRDAYPRLSNVIDPLVQITSQSPRNDYLADAPLYERLHTCLPDDISADFEEQTTLEAPHPTSTGAWLDRLLHANAKEFFTTLREEVMRHRAGERFVSRIAIHEKKVVLFPPIQIPEEFKQRPVILLNATPDTRALRAVLGTEGCPISEYQAHVALDPGTQVTYLIGANHSMTTLWKNQASLDRWVTELRAMVEREGRTLVVSTKGLEHELERAVGDLINDGRVALDA